MVDGYIVAGVVDCVIVVGTVGYTREGEVEDSPPLNVEGYVYVAEDALPHNPVGLLVSADTSIT